MTFREEVVDVLQRRAEPNVFDTIAGFRVQRILLPIQRWEGARPDSLGQDCRKRRSLLVGSDHGMSCVEVEVVRRLQERWAAGWVQGFPCGGQTWGDFIWKSLPPPLAHLNESVQHQRGQRQLSTFSGHPDVAVTDGQAVCYLECKMDDDLKPSQIDWFSSAFAGAVVSPDDVLVVQGISRSELASRQTK